MITSHVIGHVNGCKLTRTTKKKQKESDSHGQNRRDGPLDTHTRGFGSCADTFFVVVVLELKEQTGLGRLSDAY